MALVCQIESWRSAAPTDHSNHAVLVELGSVKLICNSDLLKAQMAKQRIHLAAAREVILAGAGRPGLEHPHHRVEQFLLQEFYEISAWTQLTTFSRVDNILMDPPTSNQTRCWLTSFASITSPN